MANKQSDLRTKLSKADPTVKAFFSELMSRNVDLQRQIVKLEADVIERDNRIKALERIRSQRGQK